MRSALLAFGFLACLAAVVMSLAGADVNSQGVPRGMNPVAAIAMAMTAFAMFRGADAMGNANG